MLELWLIENEGTALTGIGERLDEIQERVAAQSARFPIVAKGELILHDVDRRSILGWRDTEAMEKPGEFRLRFVDILPTTFLEWGWDKRDVKAVMRHLRDAKLLICNKPNELTMRRKEPQVGDRIPVYRIDAAFFGETVTFKSTPVVVGKSDVRGAVRDLNRLSGARSGGSRQRFQRCPVCRGFLPDPRMLKAGSELRPYRRNRKSWISPPAFLSLRRCSENPEIPEVIAIIDSWPRTEPRNSSRDTGRNPGRPRF